MESDIILEIDALLVWIAKTPSNRFRAECSPSPETTLLHCLNTSTICKISQDMFDILYKQFPDRKWGVNDDLFVWISKVLDKKQLEAFLTIYRRKLTISNLLLIL